MASGHLVGLGSLGEQIMEANPRFSPSASVLCNPFEFEHSPDHPANPTSLLGTLGPFYLL